MEGGRPDSVSFWSLREWQGEVLILEEAISGDGTRGRDRARKAKCTGYVMCVGGVRRRGRGSAMYEFYDAQGNVGHGVSVRVRYVHGRVSRDGA